MSFWCCCSRYLSWALEDNEGDLQDLLRWCVAIIDKQRSSHPHWSASSTTRGNCTGQSTSLLTLRVELRGSHRSSWSWEEFQRMMDSSDLHTCRLFFWGCGHFFSGSSICSSSGWHQSASRVVVTRDRGKGCDMVLSTPCKQARPQSTPASSIMQVSPLWLSGHGEGERGREREPNVGFLVLSAANPVLAPDSPSWEQDLIVLRTHRSLLVVDGQTQHNGNYPDCCDHDAEAQICENNFKRIAGFCTSDEVHYFAEENISSVVIV